MQLKSLTNHTGCWWEGIGLAAMALALSGPVAVQAQTAQVTAALGNFDVVNYTTKPTHGYEVEIEGVQATAVYATFSVERYGAPKIITTPTGSVIVRYESPYDPVAKRWIETTVAHAPNTAFQGTCYSWYPATYPASGCEHFGIALSNTTYGKITHRWLVENPAAPGTLMPYLPAAIVPLPYYSVAPPAQPGLPPVVVAEVEAPDAPDAPDQFGDAQWMKIFVRQLPQVVTLNQLVADNPVIVPMDPAQLEVNWQLIQADPPSGNAKRNRTRTRNQGGIDPTTQTVVRRIELYKYNGRYDPVTHEALCADTLCNAPSAGEQGDFLSAQMTAAQVQSDSVTVTIRGGGKVESTDKRIACPNKCVAPYNRGTSVVLTAKPNSGSTFAGWFGACTGTSTTCTVSAVGHVTVGAAFTTLPTAPPPTTGGGGGGGGTSGGGGGTSGGGSGGSGKTP